jgi:acyl-coenzyme A thioesterase PaaI-like protein
MNMFQVIKEQFNVPFATHAGVEITDVADGQGTARMPQTETSINHIGSQHAGALFTLGEAASGAAMAGAFAPVILEVRPIAGKAEITYTKVAKGMITAHARTMLPGAELLEKLNADGKVAFDVTVNLTNADGDQVAQMTVAWHVKKT